VREDASDMNLKSSDFELPTERHAGTNNFTDEGCTVCQ
jgi:hypothetical protein